MENSFFEFRKSAGGGSEVSLEKVIDESMLSVDAIDDSMRSNDSFSLLRSVPPSARKQQMVIADSDDDDDRNMSMRSIRSFSLGGAESADSSFIGRKKGKKPTALIESSSDTDDMTPDDDVVTSAATRMSILGYKPKDMKDDSDYIDSDDPKSGFSSKSSSLSDLPEIELSHYSEKISPIKTSKSYSEREVTSIKKEQNSFKREEREKNKFSVKSDDQKWKDDVIVIDQDVSMTEDPQDVMALLTDDESDIENMAPNRSKSVEKPKKGITTNTKAEDDDIQLIEKSHNIVNLTSDNEDDIMILSEYKPKVKQEETDQKSITKYLMPKSYPNANVVYVQEHIKINETNKLEKLREELHKIQYLLETVVPKDLPDGGRKLQERLSTLERGVREQAEKVAAMVVEPVRPTAEDMNRDGFGKVKDEVYEPTWDDLQAGTTKVQPKMFGKQAMFTHMQERDLIMERLKDLHESLASRPAETEHARPPLALRATLMAHQTHALAWLQWRETQRPRGGILADDMGLGKTLTMISLMLADKESNLEKEDEREQWNNKEKSKLVAGGTLVVCPASLLQQWAGEVERHCRSHFLSVCQHHGPARSTQPYKLASHDLVITTYNIVGRDLDKQGVLMRIRWTRVILDEAHIVRNHKALTSRAVSALHAARRWCLTGTPVQNKELDVFALLKFMKCTPFDDIQMWKKWIDNKSAGGQERMATLMRTLMLRRTKVQLQQSGALKCLPERTSHSVDLTLTKDEMNVYQKVLVFSKTLFAQFLHQRAMKQADMADGFLTSKPNEAYDKMHKRMVALHGARPVKSHEILVLLLRLRQLCCHAGLISAMLDPEAEQRSDSEEDPGGIDLLSELNRLTIEEQDNEELGEPGVADEGTTVAEALRSVLSPSNPVFSYENPSSKIKAVLKCLRENVLDTTEDKVVVVSQWTSVLSLVERELKAADIACLTLSGAVPVPARAAIVDDFNRPSKRRILLLSLCAGGVGLNLCGANHLLLLDPHWNPQLEEQAQDRIYRVGQTKPVHIYKFITLDTVEQSIKRLQEHKLELASNVLTGAKHTNSSKLTIEDLKLLFNMPSKQGPKTS